MQETDFASSKPNSGNVRAYFKAVPRNSALLSDFPLITNRTLVAYNHIGVEDVARLSENDRLRINLERSPCSTLLKSVSIQSRLGRSLYRRYRLRWRQAAQRSQIFLRTSIARD